jgi:hypothetical protein
MGINFVFWVLFAAIIIGLFIFGLVYRRRDRQRHSRACFEAMLRMLLQPTSTNIAALDALLVKRRLSKKVRYELLHQAELEADCLSMMPTGELRSSQPFLEKRYGQILATAEINRAVAELVKVRLASF